MGLSQALEAPSRAPAPSSSVFSGQRGQPKRAPAPSDLSWKAEIDNNPLEMIQRSDLKK